MVLAAIGGLAWFKSGGWAMYPLLALSIYALYVILERSAYLATRRKRLDQSVAAALRGVSAPEQLEGELSLCLAQCLAENHYDELSAESAVEREMQEAARGVGMLDTIQAAGPMFGLIGTVSGMINVFYKVAQVQGALNVRLLSTGISEALVATWTGLAVALFAFFAHRILRGRLLNIENTLFARAEDARLLIVRRQRQAAATSAKPATGSAP